MYWDANDLYGWVMIQSLPICDFKFLSEKEVGRFDLSSIDENSLVGYILDCDLEYCKKLHDSHNDYALCPEKIGISSNMLSIYCSDIADKHGIKVDGLKKLVPNLCDKVGYVVFNTKNNFFLNC